MFQLEETCLNLQKLVYSKLHFSFSQFFFVVFQVDIDSITPVSVTEEEFLKRKEAADTHDEEAAEVNINFFPLVKSKVILTLYCGTHN